MVKEDILEHLCELTSLDEGAVLRALFVRAGQECPRDLSIDAPRPSWLQRTAVQWMIELWQGERNNCESDNLWSVDQKYTRILKYYTVADIVSMLSELNQGDE